MKIEVTSDGRTGLRPQVLFVLERRHLSLRSIEVAANRTYLDVEATSTAGFVGLIDDLMALNGVQAARQIELLPHECQRMQFEVLLNAISYPLIAVDMSANIIHANASAMEVFALQADSLLARPPLKALVDAELGDCLVARLRSCAGGEVSVSGKPFLVDVLPVVEQADDSPENAHGAVFIFRAVATLGQDIYAIEKRESLGGNGLIGRSEAMLEICRLISRFAPLRAPVLITGETGTGKELVARACHRLSPRAGRPFLALNCAALPESLAESELFGYAAGAFSGAQRTGKPGLFELADGGTVFLDEIGEMSAYLQAKLLRFLQDGSFMRIGGTKETLVNVRVLAATHRELPELVKSGSFREDLYYRLNVLTIRLPAVRDRRADIPELVSHFIARAALQIGTRCSGVTAEAMACLCAYDWPGNAREMENLLFRAVTLAESETLQFADLPSEIRRARSNAGQLARSSEEIATSPEPSVGEVYTARMEKMERELLSELYAKYPSTRKLATQLGLSHSSVAGKLRRLGIAK
ncbi:MAG: hypothetical protein A2710_18150 [Burkholderiales bacterium RIFCSPHIGHO2_01_FULL_64_960]|nr:MAG: hypothetical protein A2710_18150 [Burkholderiales bacterium RIFCSPHIGHO2_01_FULL_64_960]